MVGAWLLVISSLSTDPFSAQNTHRYIDPVLRWLFPNLSPAGFVTAHTLIRKSAHFTEFFILGLLVFWASRQGEATRWRWRWSLQAVGLSAAWALIDELHQSFVLTRTASLADSAIDTLGAIASQIFLRLRTLCWQHTRETDADSLGAPLYPASADRHSKRRESPAKT